MSLKVRKVSFCIRKGLNRMRAVYTGHVVLGSDSLIRVGRGVFVKRL